MELYLFEDLLKARDDADLQAGVQRIVEKLGFDHFQYGLIYRQPGASNPCHFLLGTYPQHWLERYFEGGFIHIDPAIIHCLGNTTPLVFSNILYEDSGCGEMNRDAIDCGIDGGGCIPVHTPWLNGAGIFAFSTGDSADRVAGYVAEVSGQMTLLTAYLNQAVRNLSLPPVLRFKQAQELTPREQECLRWSASGLPPKKVADRMGLSLATVNALHLPSIRRKLGARTTCEAIVIAITHGLIHP